MDPKYYCIESTFDIHYLEWQVRLWIHEEYLPREVRFDVERTVLNELYALDAGDLLTSREIAESIARAVPDANAIQVIQRASFPHTAYGVMLYLVPFCSKDDE